MWIHDNFTNENGVSRSTMTKVAIAEWRITETNPDPVATLYMDAGVYGVTHGHRCRYRIQHGKTGPCYWEGNSLTKAIEQGDALARELANPKEFAMDGKVLECGRNKYIDGGGKWPVPKTWPDGTKVKITVRRVESNE